MKCYVVKFIDESEIKVPVKGVNYGIFYAKNEVALFHLIDSDLSPYECKFFVFKGYGGGVWWNVIAEDEDVKRSLIWQGETASSINYEIEYELGENKSIKWRTFGKHFSLKEQT
jgi:hypothetical protein